MAHVREEPLEKKRVLQESFKNLRGHKPPHNATTLQQNKTLTARLVKGEWWAS